MPDSRSDYPTRPSWNDVDDGLDSWKEIATYLERTVVTVERWEKEEGLPVHRHVHNKQATVYASRSEIDAWLADRSTTLGIDKPGWPRFFSEKKKIVAGGVTLLLLVGLVAWMDIGSSSNPEGLGFQQRDWVLIADFDNRTGESVFDGVLEYALRREISNSQFVNVVPRERIQDSLRLMKKPPETVVDASVGREICLRDGGIRALLAGRVEKLGSVNVLSVEVINPVQGVSVASATQEAAGEEQIWAAVRELSSWARQTLGEAISQIQKSTERLVKVTTPSLPALKLYSQAMAMSNQWIPRSDPTIVSEGKFLLPSRWVTMEPLLRQAVAEDPEFASAHLWLAWAPENQSKPAEEYLPHAERALELSEVTSERERYFILASYHEMKDQTEQAMAAYQALISLYPDHYWATNNLAEANDELGRIPEAMKYFARSADLRPQSFSDNGLTGLYLATTGGDLVAAEPYMERARQLMVSEDLLGADDAVAMVGLFPAWKALIDGDPQEALQLADQAAETIQRPNPKVAALYFILGKLRLAGDWSESRHFERAMMAYGLGNDQVAKEQLISFIETPDEKQGMASFAVKGRRYPPGFVILSAKLGLLSHQGLEPERMNTRSIAVRGAIALEQGNLAEGTDLLEKAVQWYQKYGYGNVYFLVLDILADAWEQQGEFEQAARALEEASSKKTLLVKGGTAPLWVRIQWRLAEVYRRLGREEDTRRIEEELLKLLTYADPDHPILRQLDHTKDLALREPTNN